MAFQGSTVQFIYARNLKIAGLPKTKKEHQPVGNRLKQDPPGNGKPCWPLKPLERKEGFKWQRAAV